MKDYKLLNPWAKNMVEMWGLDKSNMLSNKNSY